MKNFKITKLNKAEAALVGMPVPKQKNGNIGNGVHSTVDDLGYQVSKTGVDLPKIKTEIKTKGNESKSAYAIGSLHIDKIKELEYDVSPIKEKCQNIFKVAHSQTFMKITSAKIMDFTKEDIQEKFRDAYNTARDKMLAGDDSNYIKGHDKAYGYFERKKKNGLPTNNWAFRITVKNMNMFEGMSKSNGDNLFY